MQTFIKVDILYANKQDRQGKQMKWLSHLISVSLRNVSKSQSQIKKKYMINMLSTEWFTVFLILSWKPKKKKKELGILYYWWIVLCANNDSLTYVGWHFWFIASCTEGNILFSKIQQKKKMSVQTLSIQRKKAKCVLLTLLLLPLIQKRTGQI